MNRIKNERGFLLLNAVFLTLITSLAAMILFNAAPRIKNPNATLRLTALYLANEQFAQLESLAANGETLQTIDLTKPEDRKTKNAGAEIEFTVKTQIGGTNPHDVTVKVSWEFGGKNFEIESKRAIWIVPKENTAE